MVFHGDSYHECRNESPSHRVVRSKLTPASPRSARNSFPNCSTRVAYANEIWKRDPFDVESIHPGARETFQRIVGRVREASGLPTGRILLLLGESGCGKTHLMRAFRNQVHARSSGYCGYLQMTAFTGQYGRYVLNNLIDSLDKPYDESRSETTGLMRLSNALAESSRDVPRDWLDRLRDGGLDQPSLDQLVAEMADRIILDDRFNTIDVYLVQVLLYLQCNDPRIKARVLKYLRCEDLTEHDRRLLGGIVPCTYPDAPHRLIQRLGQSMWAVENVPLVLCVDQLEDIFDLDDAAVKFRRAMATLCDLVSRLPLGHRGHRLPRRLLRQAEGAAHPADQGPGRERPATARPGNPLRPQPGRTAHRPTAEISVRVDGYPRPARSADCSRSRTR